MSTPKRKKSHNQVKVSKNFSKNKIKKSTYLKLLGLLVG